MVKNDKSCILHFSVNTTQVPCCTRGDLTSLYFSKNTISIDKGCSLPLTQSFAAQLLCLDQQALVRSSSPYYLVSVSPRWERLRVVHAVTAQAVEEERARRSTLRGFGRRRARMRC